MSFLLNVSGDIYAVNSTGPYFTTINTPDTIIDIIQLNSAKKEYYFKYRLTQKYAYATSQKEIFATSARNTPGTIFKIEENSGRIIDITGFTYEIMIKNIVIAEVVENATLKPSMVEKPVETRPDEKIVTVQDYKTNSEWNQAPSDGFNKWDYKQHSEIWRPDHSDPSNVEYNIDLMEKNGTKKNIELYESPAGSKINVLMFAIAGLVVVTALATTMKK